MELVQQDALKWYPTRIRAVSSADMIIYPVDMATQGIHKYQGNIG